MNTTNCFIKKTAQNDILNHKDQTAAAACEVLHQLTPEFLSTMTVN